MRLGRWIDRGNARGISGGRGETGPLAGRYSLRQQQVNRCIVVGARPGDEHAVADFDELRDVDAALAAAPEGLPRLFLLEEECRKAVVQAELDWVRGVIDDLRTGRLAWSEDWLREIAEAFSNADEQDD